MDRVATILNILAKKYPNPKTALNFKSLFQLLVATILSAQSTDKQVNRITENLFSKYPTIEHFLQLTEDELAAEIKGCGLYQTKSKNILAACRMLQQNYGGKVPTTLDELIKLPGVGRKTANVIISSGFGQNAIAVDTHVFRVANRLGLANSQNVLGTEMDLQKNIPEILWSLAHHWLIFHGREVCKARKPKCTICELREYCPQAESFS